MSQYNDKKSESNLEKSLTPVFEKPKESNTSAVREGRDSQMRDMDALRLKIRSKIGRHGPLEIPLEYLPERDKYRYEWVALDRRHPHRFKHKMDIGYEPVKDDLLLGGAKSVGDDFLTSKGVISTGGHVIQKDNEHVELYLCRVPHEIYAEIEAMNYQDAMAAVGRAQSKADEPGFYGNISTSRDNKY